MNHNAHMVCKGEWVNSQDVDASKRSLIVQFKTIYLYFS